MSITNNLTTAGRINFELSKILGGEYLDDRRVTIALAYCNLSLDHHTAIILLFRNKLYGSGLALVRSVFEAMLRAHWVVGCATPEEVDEVAENHDFDIGGRVEITQGWTGHTLRMRQNISDWNCLLESFQAAKT